MTSMNEYDSPTVRDVRELLNALPDEALDLSFYYVLRLMRIAQQINAFAVEKCNRQLSYGENLRWQHCEQQAIQFAESFGCISVLISDDPNAPALKLVFPSDKTNDVEHEGWIVPYNGVL